MVAPLKCSTVFYLGAFGLNCQCAGVDSRKPEPKLSWSPTNAASRCPAGLQDLLQMRLRGEGGSAEDTLDTCN
jgi:hypothetical protein